MTYNPHTLEKDDDPPDGRDGADVLGTTGNTADADRAAIVTLELVADPSGTTAGQITLDVSSLRVAVHRTRAEAGLGAQKVDTVSFYLPPGATYDVDNNSDPDGANTATAWEWIL